MTEQQAIEILKDFDKQISAKADGAYQSTIGKMACDIAIKALKKQIPKKTVRVGDSRNETDGCSVCKTEFYQKEEFCFRCGQAINWDN